MLQIQTHARQKHNVCFLWRPASKQPDRFCAFRGHLGYLADKPTTPKADLMSFSTRRRAGGELTFETAPGSAEQSPAEILWERLEAEAA